ncbi:hypothetical protein KTD19_17325 [Burkholderia multivorans]|uniref:hypothetical protein n=1 Tax=Burkholderia multivorans TaxID=87883 RepID=UPI0012DFA33E|nr:hypothetical protein [Burkholderia multivorans]MBU9234142.1 hypothetical protein [Burkholderia multivorans]QGR92171.1 hypothetical protein FOC30_14365 [Burkholderia multivorans]HEF4734580.1 hypothetical protein [Burkholderia multivorans]
MRGDAARWAGRAVERGYADCSRRRCIVVLRERCARTHQWQAGAIARRADIKSTISAFINVPFFANCNAAPIRSVKFSSRSDSTGNNYSDL